MALFLWVAPISLSVGTSPILRTPLRAAAPFMQAVAEKPATAIGAPSDAITPEQPLEVLIAGAGVGGLILANCLELADAPVKKLASAYAAHLARTGTAFVPDATPRPPVGAAFDVR